MSIEPINANSISVKFAKTIRLNIVVALIASLVSVATMADMTITEEQVVRANESVKVSAKSIKKPSIPSSLTLPLATATNCIADSDITADNLSQAQSNGPFTISSKDIPRQSATGFGGGTIHYPINASGCGLLAAIAVVPGFVSYESSIKWLGPRLASWGFVVMTINTNSIYDNPDSRAEQLSAALDTIISDNSVGPIVDPNRLGAIGWSMGGGGALKLATVRKEVRAIVPLAPYHDQDYGEVSTPTLVIACEFDRIARNKKYGSVFYDKAIGPKMKVEVNNASHFCPSYRFNEILLSKPIIAWMQRYINEDKRFDKFLCDNENYSDSSRISSYDHANCL